MNTHHKGKINILVLLIYLVTMQVGAGIALYSIYVAVSDGTICLKEKTKRPFAQKNITLRKHINVSSNEKITGNSALIVHLFTPNEIKDFVYIKTTKELSIFAFTAYVNIKDRAPPQIV